MLLAMFVIFSVSVPVFDIDTIVSFHCPTLTEASIMVDLLKSADGIPIPYPDKTIVSGLVGALLVKSTDELRVPIESGTNRIVSLKVWPGGIVSVTGRVVK